MVSPDLTRLQRLAHDGDEDARQALLSKALRRNDPHLLRTALPPCEHTPEGWETLCQHIGRTPALLTPSALDTLDAAIDDWPAPLRVCPNPWNEEPGIPLELVRTATAYQLGLGVRNTSLAHARRLLDSLQRLTHLDALPGNRLGLLLDTPRLPALQHLELEHLLWHKLDIEGLLSWLAQRPLRHLGLNPVHTADPRSLHNVQHLASFTPTQGPLRSLALTPVPGTEHMSGFWDALWEGPLLTHIHTLTLPADLPRLVPALEDPRFPPPRLTHLSLRGAAQDTAEWLIRHAHKLEPLEQITIEVPRPRLVAVWKELRRAFTALDVEVDMGPFLNLTTSPSYLTLLDHTRSGDASGTRALEEAIDTARPPHPHRRPDPTRWTLDSFRQHLREHLPDAAILRDPQACVGDLSAARSLAAVSRCFGHKTPQALEAPALEPGLWKTLVQRLDAANDWSVLDSERLDAALQHWPDAWRVLPEHWVRSALVEGQCDHRLPLGRILDLASFQAPTTLRYTYVCNCMKPRRHGHAFQHLAQCEALSGMTSILNVPAHLKPPRGLPTPLASLTQSSHFQGLKNLGLRGVPGDALDALFDWLDVRPIAHLNIALSNHTPLQAEGLFRFQGQHLQHLTLDIPGDTRTWTQTLKQVLRAPGLRHATTLTLPRRIDLEATRQLVSHADLSHLERLRCHATPEALHWLRERLPQLTITALA